MVYHDARVLSRVGTALIAGWIVLAGCDSDPESTIVCTPGGPGTTLPPSCSSDPLRTNLPPLWNGLSVDIYDCPILEFTAKYAEPDAMIFKAIIKVESNFEYAAIGCKDRGPCCDEIGWTAKECGCLGVMQDSPACGERSGLGLLSDGHPNMSSDPNCAEFNNSIFNPVVNIEIGIAGVSRNRKRMKDSFPGCTEDQYTMMAIGEYNHYKSTQSCTVYNSSYDSAVLKAYNEYSTAAGWAAHPYVAQ